ncbi:uncharacterized protein L3040_005004 [Drepanopeziza brunnea f. sp. 'multigermtubi']|uniref:uncharacterized protein n=1 Tax=Drepanopeziza brunnea f. sp. 'multigermtubi' TaxID=698441 RepID=UPI002389A601|nr:hypothetical protein L3040_005004 [Drepanopeziza brunnea f. sp. 'multigermtubi']
MNAISQVAFDNGGPVRPPAGSVIDLTSDSEEGEDVFADSLESPFKNERPDAMNRKLPEPAAEVENLPPSVLPPIHQPVLPPLQRRPELANRQAVWEDYFLVQEFNDEVVAGAFDFEGDLAMHPLPPQQAPASPDSAPAVPASMLSAQQNVPTEAASRVTCIDTLVDMFPDICRDYVSELYDTISKSSQVLITHILDKIDKGTPYPNAKDKQKVLKRKREVDEDQEAARKYGAPEREMSAAIGGVRPFIAKILSLEFTRTPISFIASTCSQTKYRLFSAYEILEEAQRTYNKDQDPPYVMLKNARRGDDYSPAKTAAYLASPAGLNGVVDQEKVEIYEELQAARRIRDKADQRRAAERAAEAEEAENVARAEADGTMSECGCCYCDYPMNRMVHCNGDEMHWFCRGCAKRNAEVEVGKSKYELLCMSTDKCSGGFSSDQRAQFLDDNTKVALERNEQEANLRLAGIENLASCPFCPFAAEYPPVEVNREFRCQDSECERVSCRLCKLDSHIPKTCEENAKENGLSIRRQIEEAMSAAMIRKCNKCGTPFVKEEGCNKMSCTRNGCRNIQCYVCSKSCDYNHFNDPSRGGKLGNCPLFESAEKRHNEEVQKAEKDTLAKILADHPEYTEDDLKVKVSENVRKAEEKRKERVDPVLRHIEVMQARAGRPDFRNDDDSGDEMDLDQAEGIAFPGLLPQIRARVFAPQFRAPPPRIAAQVRGDDILRQVEIAPVDLALLREQMNRIHARRAELAVPQAAAQERFDNAAMRKKRDFEAAARVRYLQAMIRSRGGGPLDGPVPPAPQERLLRPANAPEVAVGEQLAPNQDHSRELGFLQGWEPAGREVYRQQRMAGYHDVGERGIMQNMGPELQVALMEGPLGRPAVQILKGRQAAPEDVSVVGSAEAPPDERIVGRGERNHRRQAVANGNQTQFNHIHAQPLQPAGMYGRAAALRQAFHARIRQRALEGNLVDIARKQDQAAVARARHRIGLGLGAGIDAAQRRDDVEAGAGGIQREKAVGREGRLPIIGADGGNAHVKNIEELELELRNALEAEKRNKKTAARAEQLRSPLENLERDLALPARLFMAVRRDLPPAQPMPGPAPERGAVEGPNAQQRQRIGDIAHRSFGAPLRGHHRKDGVNHGLQIDAVARALDRARQHAQQQAEQRAQQQAQQYAAMIAAQQQAQQQARQQAAAMIARLNAGPAPRYPGIAGELWGEMRRGVVLPRVRKAGKYAHLERELMEEAEREKSGTE